MRFEEQPSHPFSPAQDARGLVKWLLRTGIVRTRRGAVRVLVGIIVVAFVASAAALYRSSTSAQSYGNYGEFLDQKFNNQ